MNANQYMSAIRISTEAAIRGGRVSLPEIIGCLELAKINVDRQAFQASQNQPPAEKPRIIVPPPVAPGEQ